MKVRIVNKSEMALPTYATVGSAGMDLASNSKEDIVLKPLERALVPTGMFIELPQGYEAQLRPRSGLSIKHGITLINCIGTVDSDFRGEIKIPLVNLSNSEYTVKYGERVAQMVIARYEQIDWTQVDDLSPTGRGGCGFGSTGK